MRWVCCPDRCDLVFEVDLVVEERLDKGLSSTGGSEGLALL